MYEVETKDLARTIVLWNGVDIAVSFYSRTHSMLMLEFKRVKPTNYLLLVCGGTEFFSGPFCWSNNQVELKGLTSVEQEIMIQDASIGMIIRCHGVSAYIGPEGVLPGPTTGASPIGS